MLGVDTTCSRQPRTQVVAHNAASGASSTRPRAPMGTTSPHRRRATGLSRTLSLSRPGESPFKTVALGGLALNLGSGGPVDAHVEAARLARADRAKRVGGIAVVTDQQLDKPEDIAVATVDHLVLHFDEVPELAGTRTAGVVVQALVAGTTQLDVV